MSFWERLRTLRGETGDAQAEVRASRTLEWLKGRLKKMAHPRLLDMGYTTGANIDFFVRLGCKVHVDDYIATTLQRRADRPARRPDAGGSHRAPLAGRRRDRRSAGAKPRVEIPPVEYETGQFDVVLCWDLFDYLSPEEAIQAGREIRRIISEGGYLLGYFGPRQEDAVRAPRRFRIRGDGIEVQELEGPRVQPFHLANRDLQKIFPDFEVSQTILLRSGVREVLLRKKTSAGRRRSSPLLCTQV